MDTCTDQYCMLGRQHGCNMRDDYFLSGLMGLCCAAFSAVFLCLLGAVKGVSETHVPQHHFHVFFFLPLSAVPAPDVRYCVQLSLDQQGQMLWPPVYGKATPTSTSGPFNITYITLPPPGYLRLKTVTLWSEIGCSCTLACEEHLLCSGITEKHKHKK